jgi:hypothetical protein
LLEGLSYTSAAPHQVLAIHPTSDLTRLADCAAAAAAAAGFRVVALRKGPQVVSVATLRWAVQHAHSRSAHQQSSKYAGTQICRQAVMQ